MPTPQPGVFAQGTRVHRHLEFDARADIEPGTVLAALQPLRQPSVTAGGANIVVGFGPELWRRLAPGSCPTLVADLTDIPGVPVTQHDVWIWVHGPSEDVLFDVSRHIAHLLSEVTSLVTDLGGFVYKDSRDLTGFIDGTENPAIEEAYEIVAVPDGGPGAGGSFALTQRWVHDLDAFEALAVEEQEHVIGRTKQDSIELDADRKPTTAHIARVVLEEDGHELEIYRRSVPYGGIAEHGLFFVAFSADPGHFTKMLRRMFGVSGDGLHDRLTDFSRPATGSVYFVPSLEDLGAALG